MCSYQLHSKKLDVKRFYTRKIPESQKSWPTSFSQLQKLQNAFSIIDGFCVANAIICSLWKPIERNAVCQKCVVTNFTQKNWRRSASIPERSLSPEKVGQLLFCNYKNYKTFFQELMVFVLLMLWFAPFEKQLSKKLAVKNV